MFQSDNRQTQQQLGPKLGEGEGSGFQKEDAPGNGTSLNSCPLAGLHWMSSSANAEQEQERLRGGEEFLQRRCEDEALGRTFHPLPTSRREPSVTCSPGPVGAALAGVPAPV